MTTTTRCGVTLAETDSMIYPLTPCCGATTKGSVAGDTPVMVCRACYKEVPDALDCFAESDRPLALLPEVIALVSATQGKRCPCPQECAAESLYQLREASF